MSLVRVVTTIWLAAWISLLAIPASGELYIGGQLGVVLPMGFYNAEGTGAAAGMDFGNLGLHQSVLYGGKVGYYLPSFLSWIGAEADVAHATPHFRTANSLPQGLRFSLTTVALRAMVRNPGGEDARFQPYVGLGPAFFFASTSNGASASRDTALGFSFQAGGRYFVTPTVAAFAEYKFDAAMMRLPTALGPGAGLQGDYNGHNVVIGLSYHFGRYQP